jgi:hypothetical protein
MKRRVTIETPLGEMLQFRQLVGREALSQLYAFDIQLLGRHNSIKPKALLGKPATVVMETESGASRYLSGLVTRFGLSQQDSRQSFYKMRLRPWLWLGDTSEAGQTRLVNSEMAIGLKGYKSIMRTSERVTENWPSALQAKAGQVEARSAPAPGSAPGSEAA